MKKVLVGLVLAVSVFVFGGCAVVLIGAGAGTVAYVRGDLQSIVEADINRTYAASEKTVSELELKIEEKQKDQFYAKIVARNAADKKVKITIKSTGDNSCEMSIRVGTWGDQEQSYRIHEKIRANL